MRRVSGGDAVMLCGLIIFVVIASSCRWKNIEGCKQLIVEGCCCASVVYVYVRVSEVCAQSTHVSTRNKL